MPTRKQNGIPLTCHSIPDDVHPTIVYGDIKPAGKSRNRGASECSKPFIMFVDDDVTFDWEKVMRKIGECLEDHDIVSIHGSRLLVLRKDTFTTVRGFDSRIRWWEDYEFLLRALNMGYRIKMLPWHLIKHSGGWSNRSLYRLWSWSNIVYFISKHGFFPLNAFVPKNERLRLGKKVMIIKPRHILFGINLRQRHILGQAMRQVFRWVGFFVHVFWRIKEWLH
jgi:GT2 family glycosyltransferase